VSRDVTCAAPVAHSAASGMSTLPIRGRPTGRSLLFFPSPLFLPCPLSPPLSPASLLPPPPVSTRGGTRAHTSRSQRLTDLRGLYTAYTYTHRCIPILLHLYYQESARKIRQAVDGPSLSRFSFFHLASFLGGVGATNGPSLMPLLLPVPLDIGASARAHTHTHRYTRTHKQTLKIGCYFYVRSHG
jgi:hypothetical protein